MFQDSSIDDNSGLKDGSVLVLFLHQDENLKMLEQKKKASGNEVKSVFPESCLSGEGGRDSGDEGDEERDRNMRDGDRNMRDGERN